MANSVTYALAYAALLPGTVLPVQAGGKRPVMGSWQNEATTDPDALRRWFGGGKVNVGWQPKDDIMVLDVDQKPDDCGINGFGSLARLEARFGTLPSTLSATTPTGGRHFVFRLPAGVTVKNLVGSKAGCAGLDVRTRGGQIVVAPSERAEGAYAWDNWNPLSGEAPFIAEAPDWLVKLARGELDRAAPKSKGKGGAPAKRSKGALVAVGSRNATLVKEAGRLRRVGYDEEAMVAALQALNRSQFAEPVPEKEVMAVAAWACEKFEPTEGADITSQQGFDEWKEEIESAEGIGEILDIARRISLDDGLTRTEAGALLKAAARQAGVSIKDMRADLQAGGDREDSRPVIRVRKHDFAGSVDDCIKVLAGIPSLRQRGSELVEIVADEAGTRLQSLTIARLAYLTSQAALWRHGDSDGGPAPDVLQAVLAAGAWAGVPKIVGLLHQPTIDLKIGDVISGRGYVPSLQREAVFEPASFPPYDADDALAQLRALLAGFPFPTARDEAAALAGILTAAIRPVLPTAPGFLVSACDYGSGKTYLSRLIAAFAGGAGVQRWPGRQEDQSKVLFSLLLEGRSAVIFDNMTFDWSSGTMAAILTDPTFSDRQLGASKSPEVSTCCLWVGNGVNVAPANDLQRRVISIGLDAHCERPWERTFNRDPLAEVEADRGKWLMLALRVLSDFVKAGMMPQLSSLGSFGDWSRVVRGAVVAAGLPDPVQALGANVGDGEERELLARLLYHWRHSEFFGEALTSRQLVAHVANASGDSHEAGLRYVLEDVARERGEISLRKVGNWFRSCKGKVVDGMRLLTVGARGEHGVLWSVQVVAKG